MPRVSPPVYALNGGEVGDEALSRLDLERLQFAGSLYSNVLPRIIGSMTLRPGLEHVADIDLGEVYLLEYSYSGSSALVPVLSHLEMRVLKDGVLVTRPAVSTAVVNGDFGSFSGWTDASVGSAAASVSGGLLAMDATAQDDAIAKQTISIAGADVGVEHGLRVDVLRGPIKVRIGTSDGADDLIREATLDDGVHSIAFTPTGGAAYLQLTSTQARQVLVQSCTIDAAGPMVLPTPWTASDLAANIIRYKQGLDILYVASGVYQQREIQRRGNTSWGIQRFKTEDGPFVTSTGDISLQPNAFTGIGTLTANKSYFDPRMIGRLFRLAQGTQTVAEVFSTAPAIGDPVRISGVGDARLVFYTVSGTWSGTVRGQIATDDGSGNPGTWTDVFTVTSNVSDAYQDEDDNVIKFFRFALQTGDLTSGTVSTVIGYSGGSGVGVARMIGYTSPTQVTVEVIQRLYALNATFEWDYSTWSDYDGWPAAVETFGGRIFWGKGDFINGSAPDAYKSYDNEIEGDSAPIARSIGANTDRGILWMLGLQRLLAGTDNSEISVKSSSFDEPLTATAWFPVESSTQGGISLRAVRCDKDGIFVQASGTGVFAMVTEQGSLDYGALDLTEMHEHICDGSPVVDIAVQRRPDTVVWFILANGEARALTYRPSQKVIAWSRVVTDGSFKRVIATRGLGQDNVYFVDVRNGTRRLERLADQSDCRGGALNCLADGFTRLTATSGQTSFSVPHLDGLDVTVWANGVAIHDQSDLYTVSGGVVVLPAQTAGTRVVIGLPYVGRWQSTKLAYGAANGTALFQRKRVAKLGLSLLHTMLDGLRVGKSFDALRRLATAKGGKPIEAGHLFESYDADMMSVSSDWSTDSRICLEAQSPYPFTAASLVMDITTNG